MSDGKDGVQSQSNQSRQRRAARAIRDAYQCYLDWHGEWDGTDGGDVSTFLDYVRDELGVLPASQHGPEYRRGVTPEKADVAEFTCPTCGGHYYGTEAPPGLDLRAPIEQLIGVCKGAALPGYKAGYAGCTFRWCRADDDKYGLTNHGTPA